GRHLGIGGQTVHLRFVDEQIERVQSAEDLLIGAIEVGLLLSGLMELSHTLLRTIPQLADGPELDGLGRAGLGARRLEASLQAMQTVVSGKNPMGSGIGTPPQAFSTLHTNAFPSWIDTFGSATRAVSSLTTSPWDRPS